MVRRLETKSHLEKVIEKGGDVAADKTDKKAWKLFQLRLRNDIEENIDKLLHDRIGMSKTAWILEAIQEKIKRDENGKRS